MTLPTFINPAAANHRARELWHRMEPRLRAAGWTCHAHVASAPGAIARGVREAFREGAPEVLVVGGDGTLHEALQGCFTDGRQTSGAGILSWLPLGTANDTLEALPFEGAAGDPVARLLSVPVRNVDVGWVRCVGEDGEWCERAFLNVAEIGLGARVADRLARTGKRWGKASYVLATLASWSQLVADHAVVEVDDTWTRALPLSEIVIANGRAFGGGLPVMPQALADDGQLDIALLGALPAWHLPSLLLALLRGQHLLHPRVEVMMGATVKVSSAVRMPLEADGEVLGTTPATFGVLPGALRLRA
ncbi:MAG: diacylglycerol kinase family protein [Candidatus Sericytochromatia bacterium]|nr:diacylglycerol kinase family protein [Candidatus Sericytochromatia bacterium]